MHLHIMFNPYPREEDRKTHATNMAEKTKLRGILTSRIESFEEDNAANSYF
jgi:hypothetical protein